MTRTYVFHAITVFVSLFFLSTTAWASGFALYENSPKGAAMSGAFAATADDASALWYNPAGITQIQGSQLLVGFTGYQADATLEFTTSRKTYDLKKEFIPTPYIYYAKQLSDHFWAGIGIFSPFGLSNEFTETWEGRYNAYYSGNLAIEFNPNLVYKVTDALSVGLGISIQQFEVEFKQKINAGTTFVSAGGPAASANALGLFDASNDIDQVLYADDSSEFRFNVAIHYSYNDKLSFGFNYRSETDYTMDGTARYKNVHSLLQGGIYNTDISGSVTLPEMIWIGAAYRVTPDFKMSFDIVRTGWSSYDKLTFNINNDIGLRTVTKDWDDVNSYRFGFEYRLSDSLAARWGYLFDESPIPDNTIDYAMPSDNRHVLTGGIGYAFDKWTIDSHYALVAIMGSDRKIATRLDEGIIADSKITNSFVHQLGISISRSF